jgi:Rrf2 family protein
MWLTRRSIYAIRVLLELARCEGAAADERAGGRRPATRHQLARAQALPESFLAQVLRDLAHAGLIRLQRGSHGGVWLAQPPDQIPILSVIEAVEGPLAFAPCLRRPPACPLADRCPFAPVAAEAQESLVQVLQRRTLAGLLAQAAHA